MKALLIVDMCKGFVDRETEDGPCALYMPAARSLIAKINTLMSYMDKDDWIVVHVNDSHEEFDPELKRFPEHCMVATEEHETADGFNYGRLEVFDEPKNTFSAFADTDLVNLLCEYEVEELIIVGVASDICVFFTAADAAMLEYDVSIPLDCVEPIDVERHARCMIMLRDLLGVRMTKVEELARKGLNR